VFINLTTRLSSGSVADSAFNAIPLIIIELYHNIYGSKLVVGRYHHTDDGAVVY
jgi:hypothetical protein